MARDIELTKKILQALALNDTDLQNTTNMGGTDIAKLAQTMSLPKNTVLEKLRELESEGHLAIDDESTIVFIGDSARKLLNDIKYRNIGSQNIIFHGPVHNSNIIQGDNASLTITMNFFNELQKEINASKLPDEEKKTWIKRIKDITSHPLLVELTAQVLERVMKP